MDFTDILMVDFKLEDALTNATASLANPERRIGAFFPESRAAISSKPHPVEIERYLINIGAGRLSDLMREHLIKNSSVHVSHKNDHDDPSITWFRAEIYVMPLDEAQSAMEALYSARAKINEYQTKIEDLTHQLENLKALQAQEERG